jgi:NADH dehydrogenase
LGGPRVYSFKELMQIVLDETQRKRLLAPVPWPIARLQGRILGLLPNPLLTHDQVKMLETDNVVSEAAIAEKRTLGDLGIEATSVEAIVPSYLWMYRRQGQYAEDIRRETAS